MSGPVEKAIRKPCARRPVGDACARRAFVVNSLDASGVTLLLGERRTQTPISWACLEGVIDFLRGRGCVEVSGRHGKETKPFGTLDAHLKARIDRNTA